MWLPGVCMVPGVCVVGGVMCVVVGGRVWLLGGMRGCRGHEWLQGDVCGCWGACIGYDEIPSMSGRYASYWNAFLYLNQLSPKFNRCTNKNGIKNPSTDTCPDSSVGKS